MRRESVQIKSKIGGGKMRKAAVVAVLIIVVPLVLLLAAPGPEEGVLPSIATASAAVSRGGAGEASSASDPAQPFTKLSSWAREALKAVLFVAAAGAIGFAAMRRDAAGVFSALVFSMLFGAFVLDPSGVESWFLSLDHYVIG
jgi:hypothetical protein